MRGFVFATGAGFVALGLSAASVSQGVKARGIRSLVQFSDLAAKSLLPPLLFGLLHAPHALASNGFLSRRDATDCESESSENLAKDDTVNTEYLSTRDAESTTAGDAAEAASQTADDDEGCTWQQSRGFLQPLDPSGCSRSAHEVAAQPDNEITNGSSMQVESDRSNSKPVELAPRKSDAVYLQRTVTTEKASDRRFLAPLAAAETSAKTSIEGMTLAQKKRAIQRARELRARKQRKLAAEKAKNMRGQQKTQRQESDEAKRTSNEEVKKTSNDKVKRTSSGGFLAEPLVV